MLIVATVFPFAPCTLARKFQVMRIWTFSTDTKHSLFVHFVVLSTSHGAFVAGNSHQEQQNQNISWFHFFRLWPFYSTLYKSQIDWTDQLCKRKKFKMNFEWANFADRSFPNSFKSNFSSMMIKNTTLMSKFILSEWHGRTSFRCSLVNVIIQKLIELRPKLFTWDLTMFGWLIQPLRRRAFEKRNFQTDLFIALLRAHLQMPGW